MYSSRICLGFLYLVFEHVYINIIANIVRFSKLFEKVNTSFAVLLNFLSFYSISLSKFYLEKVALTSVSFPSVSLNFSRVRKIFLINFLSSCITKFLNLISQISQKRIFPVLDVNLKFFTSTFLVYQIYLYFKLWNEIYILFFSSDVKFDKKINLIRWINTRKVAFMVIITPIFNKFIYFQIKNCYIFFRYNYNENKALIYDNLS